MVVSPESILVRLLLLRVLTGLTAAFFASAATAFDVVDQSNTGQSTGGFSYEFYSLAQEFKPNFTTLSFVDVPVSCCSLFNPSSATLRVDIRSGGIGGPVIASSSPLVVLPGLSEEWVQFVIAPAVGLTPGATYVIELVHVSGDSGLWYFTRDTYAAGIAYKDGSPLTNADWMFRTGVLSDEPPQLPAVRVPVEYTNLFDEGALAGGGQGPLDPGQVLYTEPPDTAADSTPSNTTDFFPGTESGTEPDQQIDAIANGLDYLELEVGRNDADLVVSLAGDPVVGPSPVAAFLENRFGLATPLYRQVDLDTGDGPGVVDDVDGIELWGPLGADDALYYSRENDVSSGVSVWMDNGGVPSPFVTHAVIVAAVTSLGYSGFASEVDVDALMVRNVGAAEDPEPGDEILFSIRATPSGNFDGGEIIRLPIGGTPSFLVHGGHVWDTAFSVAARLGGSTEEVDGLEAFPSPPTIPALEIGGLALLGVLVAAAGVRAIRPSQGAASRLEG